MSARVTVVDTPFLGISTGLNMLVRGDGIGILVTRHAIEAPLYWLAHPTGVHSWFPETRAVVDDFGNLVPVPGPSTPALT